MATVTYDRRRFGSPRPRLTRVAVGVLGGYILATVALGLVGIPLRRAGLLTDDGLLASPFRHGGPWATLAHLIAIAAATGAGAALIAPCAASHIGRPVSTMWLWGILLVTGFPPIVHRGLLPLTTPMVWLAVAVLVHAYAVDAPPTAITEYLDRSARGLRIGLLAAAGVAVVFAGAYGVTHPFSFDDGGFAWETSVPNAEGGSHHVLFDPKHGGSFEFKVRSSGLLHPRVTAAGLPADERSLPVSALVAAKATGDTTSVTLKFRPVDLQCTGSDFRFSRVIVSYRVLGRSLSQPIRLDPVPTLLCR